jgi:hypothetical protein
MHCPVRRFLVIVAMFVMCHCSITCGAVGTRVQRKTFEKHKLAQWRQDITEHKVGPVFIIHFISYKPTLPTLSTPHFVVQCH